MAFAPIDWGAVGAVIFDVDGTLYDQRALRRRMALALAAHYAPRPWRLADLAILASYRRAIERNAGAHAPDLAMRELEWAARATGAAPERVARVVERWIHTAPLRHLPGCAHADAGRLIEELARRGIRTGVFSDHPAERKLEALGLRVDAVCAATDPDIARLKPDPRGLLVCAERLRTPALRCLVIGDRDDRDGAAARAAGMAHLILERRASAAPGRFRRFAELVAALQQAQ